MSTLQAKDEEVTGEYDLILYGGRYSDDLETIAFLDKTGDRYTFEPYAPEFNFAVIRNISSKEAIDKAENFVSRTSSFRHSQIRKIIDISGNIAGYELRPLYMPLTFGIDDVLDVDYRLREDKIVVNISLKPSVSRMLYNGGPEKGRPD